MQYLDAISKTTEWSLFISKANHPTPLLLLLSCFVVFDSVRPHRRQPTRLPRPWDSPGKNTGEGCHFLLQCMKVKSESEVAQSCPTLSDPLDCSLPGSSSPWDFLGISTGVGCHCLLRIPLSCHKTAGFEFKSPVSPALAGGFFASEPPGRLS